jgi:hypothetical protein
LEKKKKANIFTFMKRTLLALALLLSGVTAYSQYEIRLWSGGSAQGGLLNGTEYTFPVTTDGSHGVTFQVKNTSGASKTVGLERLRLTDMVAWEDNICWGAEGDPFGKCYTAAQMPTNPWSTPVAYYVNIASNGNGSLVVDSKTVGAGTEVYRYYVLEGSSRIDSVDVRVVSTLGISANTPDKPEVSVYPNPAINYLTVSGATSENVLEVYITDVLGKAVYSETITGTKKIDVSDFKNGVYLVAINEKGKAELTRRVVVKH